VSPPVVPRGLWWRVVLIALAGALTYWNSLSGAFILDDQVTIVDNHQIREWWRLASVLVPESDTPIAGRPLVNLSFAVNYAIGGLSVRGYHVANVAIHVVCALLAFAVVWRTLEWPRVRARLSGHSVDAAFAIALVWTVHPLNTEVVDYLTQRTESMLAMFYLLTLYAAIRAMGSRRSAGWQSLAVLSCGLGMACKESMVSAPLIVAWYDGVYVSGKQGFRARRRIYIGLAATWLVLAALNWSGPRAAVGGWSTGVSAWTYLLNQTVMIARYLRLAFWPRSLVAFYGWPLKLTLGAVMPYAFLIVFLLIVTAIAMRRQPMLGFLGVWFFVTLAPTSSIIPIATEVGAERRMYLPLLAVIALVVVGAYLAWDAVRRRWYGSAETAAPRLASVGAVLLLIGVAGALAAVSIARNREYASARTLAQTVVERRPTGIAHHVLAEQLTGAGLHDQATAHLREAVRGGDSRAGYSLGIELFNAGKLQEAVEQFDAFVRTSGLPYHLVPRWLEPPAAEVIGARTAMARAFVMQGRLPQAVEQAQAVLAVAPSHEEARLLLADALFRQQRYEEALTQYREYLRSRPDDMRALTNGGIALIATGRLDDAIVLFRHAVEIEPRTPGARLILGLALFDRGDFEGAAAQAREGVTLSPSDRAMRDLLERALAAGRSGSPRRQGS
jgi:tetratricopeptide (TPR) repeat protein